jgi:four helix bundle protein
MGCPGGDMKSYKELEIYGLSYGLALQVHRLSLELPKYELYEEGSQVRRSSKGITSCIVEGYGRRRYKAEFVKFLVYAHASCDETIVHLNFIRDTHEDIDPQGIQDLIQAYDGLGAKLNKFIKYVELEWR